MTELIDDATRPQAVLFHYFVVAATISRMAVAVSDAQRPFQQAAAYACREGLQEYASVHFSPEAGRAVRLCLVFAREKQGLE
jgi:hypothetical protein